MLSRRAARFTYSLSTFFDSAFTSSNKCITTTEENLIQRERNINTQRICQPGVQEARKTANRLLQITRFLSPGTPFFTAAWICGINNVQVYFTLFFYYYYYNIANRRRIVALPLLAGILTTACGRSFLDICQDQRI